MNDAPTELRPRRLLRSVARSWNLLSVRLAVAINVAALVVLGLFWTIDYREIRSTYEEQQVSRLREEAKVLRAAQTYLGDAATFQGFVDTFCRQMEVAVSPGHHIAMFDPSGRVIVRAHVRASPRLEASMAARRDLPDARFVMDGEEYVCASVRGGDDARIVVTQSLAPIRRVVIAQARSRAVSLGILALIIFGATSIAILLWVHDPLRHLVHVMREVGRGRFDVRARPAGTTELRSIVAGLNGMVSALESIDDDRREQMRRARDIQKRLIPADLHRAGAYDIAAAFEPADSVGGDYYDVIKLPEGGLLLTVLDVSGHGVAAALHTALLRTVFHYEAKRTSNPAVIATAMNREFSSVADSGEFATCVIMRLTADGDVCYASAGHDPGLIVGEHGSVQQLDVGGLPIGVEADVVYTSTATRLEADDVLFVYTDGVHEVFGRNGEMLGREKFVELCRSYGHSPVSPADIVDRIRAETGREHFDDDVTLLAVHRRAVRTEQTVLTTESGPESTDYDEPRTP